MFWVTGLKLLGRVGTDIFIYFFGGGGGGGEIDNFMHFERHFAFQNALNYIFFPENLKKF